ncbi:MAG: S8 family serine peptidase [Bacillota bacterium]
MRRLLALLLLTALSLSLAAGAGAAPPEEEGVRIALSAEDAAAAGLKVRHSFGRKVTAHVTQAQLEDLQRQGIAYERVPYRTVDGSALQSDKPKKGERPLPVTQVPYGVKMIYGEPWLTPDGISGGEGRIVAVLDTGSADHPDFYRGGQSIILQCVDFSQKKLQTVPGFCEDRHGHGTHVTGIVAATGGADGNGIYGVAPGASIFSYKVLTDKGGGYADDIARGIEYAADQGADIITLSFGLFEPSDLELRAIGHARSAGALVIAAAGNAGPAPGSIGYPAAFPEVVGVGALNPDESVALYSSRGLTDGSDGSITEGELELAAPGTGVLSTAYSGGYEYRSGTSMAAPHIAGLAAKMWQGSAEATRDWLVQHARDITTAEGATDAVQGFDTASGYGLPQINRLSQPLWID